MLFRNICIAVLCISLFNCDKDEVEDLKILPSTLVKTSLNYEWQKLETSFSSDDKFFILVVSHFGIPWGTTTKPVGPDYCIGNCNRDRLYFYMEKSKIQTNAIIKLSNDVPQTSHKGPPIDGSFVLYDYFIDDPPKGQYYYTSGSITIKQITDEKLFGVFEISDPFATYLPEVITGEFIAVPFYPETITED